MNVINEIQRINNLELEKGLTNTSGSWHTKYKDSSWVYAGNLPNNLTEGDVICILSQYGEIDDMHLVRDSDTGKSKGFAFVKYEDARSCVLAVDNLTGSVVLGRTLRIDHVEKYRLPKHVQDKEDEDEKQQQANNNSDDEGGDGSGVAEVGHAYKGQELASSFNIQSGHDLFAPPPPAQSSKNEQQQQSSSNTEEIGMGTGDDKEERKRRKAMRAQKRKEKEEHRRRKEERKHKTKKKKHEKSKHKSSHSDR